MAMRKPGFLNTTTNRNKRVNRYTSTNNVTQSRWTSTNNATVNRFS